MTISCQENKIDDKTLSENLEKNKHKFAFMQYYPGMSLEMEDALTLRELKNGNLIDISRNSQEEKIIYPLKFNNTQLNLNIFVQELCVTLYTDETENLGYSFYRNDFNRILNIMGYPFKTRDFFLQFV